ncbi:MAG: hypothetical protein IID16_04335 [Candidatus Marinimicrobia bacterium]|nr:hypothetical protein [Candidatus Neomarinimicrobiota bacterium]
MAGNPNYNTINLISINEITSPKRSLTYLLFLLLCPPAGGLFPDNKQDLEVIWGISFGSTEEEVIKTLQTDHNEIPNRMYQQNGYRILEYRNWGKKMGSFDKLRIMIHPSEGVFSVEEEIYLIWDLQKQDEENKERHLKEFNLIIKRLRKLYGREVFLEEPNISRAEKFSDFVSASWFLKDQRWIHLMYEPQDWNIFPELMKIVIIYRDSNRDKRKNN